MDKFLSYVCKECGKPPKQKIIHSMPSIGGEYKNMYDLPSDRKWLIETKEGDLLGVCSGNENLCMFDIIDDTYVVKILSIIILKEVLEILQIDKVIKEFGEPTQYLTPDPESGGGKLIYISKKFGVRCIRTFEVDESESIVGFSSKGCF